jgi:hypothetical protein
LNSESRVPAIQPKAKNITEETTIASFDLVKNESGMSTVPMKNQILTIIMFNQLSSEKFIFALLTGLINRI